MSDDAGESSGITDLIVGLRDAGLHLDGRELASALWLAGFIDRVTPGWSAHERLETEGQAPVAEPAGAEQEDHTLGDAGKGVGGASERCSARQPETIGDDATSVPAFPTTAGVTTGGAAAAPVAVPDRPFLRHALHLGRAWRLLRRFHASRRERFLDPEATAERLAEHRLAGHGVWEPVWCPRRTPWLHLTLIIDRGPAMPVWEPLIAELLALLRRTRAFGGIRLCQLDTGVAPLVVHEAGRVSPAEALLDPRPDAAPGRMLTLVLTDCVSRAWYEAETWTLLSLAGRNGLLALLQLLPATRWLDTALGAGSELQLRPQPGHYPRLPPLEPSAGDRDFAAESRDGESQAAEQSDILRALPALWYLNRLKYALIS
jgi:hypothetical protein